ncbi:zinc finger HIT domain-containing protein 1 isoform X2 [Ctenopharyngodon idella]|uniref:zinc finger HIT domain-containing protein 1 isoform X2 n=1 Tax=Ctenopharyngodon idella TaxID=7959 RepID=UPI00223254F4|nr:zinc finger HIT domain-containing protein 1 isoform X2 [Ctenopharyngodon idella]
MAEKKIAVRSQDPNQRRVLDSATRQRRLTRQLEALEKDNFQDDPHASLPQLVKRLPQFDESNESSKRRKKTRGDHFKQRFRKNFQTLLEEEVSKVDGVISSSVLNSYQKQSRLRSHTALLQSYVPQKHHSHLPAQ